MPRSAALILFGIAILVGLVIGLVISPALEANVAAATPVEQNLLPIALDTGFVTEILGVEYVVCPHGYTIDGLWWGYTVPMDADVIHCMNDPEPIRITQIPPEG